MDKRVIWAIKALSSVNSKRTLDKIADDPMLYDETNLQKYSAYNRVLKSFERAQKLNYSIVTYIDKNYPESLKNLTTPPPVLYVRGNVDAINHKLFAGIVGSRKCDDYGLRMAHSIAAEIAQTGVGIITGGAEGVDGAANKGALSVRGKTIAVFGSGLDVVYPKCNEALFDKIEENGGAIISEFACTTPPYRKNFPKRNRIIAAMGETLAVIRAGKRSGSLITANIANDMGKTIFAMPGNIDHRLSAGTNALINDGAQMLNSSMDVIDELIERFPDFFAEDKEEENIEYIPIEINKKETKLNIKGLSENEAEIVKAIEEGCTLQSEIEEKISFNSSRLTATLGLLELKGVIKKGIDKKYKVI